MKNRYRIFKRGWGVYYAFDNETGNSQSLQTRKKVEADRLLHAMNEAVLMTTMNTQIARAYLNSSDPEITKRNWQFVMDEMLKSKDGPTRDRFVTAMKDTAFDLLRKKPLLESRGEHVLKAIAAGTVSTNVFLRRIHNYAVGMGWLPWPLLPKKMWPAVTHKPKRAITKMEHDRIIAREINQERRAFYQLLWHLGGSQTDIAQLTAEDIDWTNNTICYNRTKLRNKDGKKIRPPLIRIGEQEAAILRSLPEIGALFPYLRQVRAGDRATEFKQRCQGLGIEGISLHSYRYSWAERARKCGYPQRYAQEALGHNSKAVHQAYAKKAEVEVPSLDQWEQQMNGRVIELKAVLSSPAAKTVNGGHRVSDITVAPTS